MLAVQLSATRPDYLVWLRKEQLQSYTWAGDPSKPIVGNDPLTLSPRRSFAAWSEIVRGTSAPWTPAELAMAGAFGDALIDIIVQVHAVRLLIAEHQLTHVREMVADSKEAVVVAAATGGAFYANAAFHALAGCAPQSCRSLDDLVARFVEAAAARQIVGHVRAEQRSWRGETALRLGDGGDRPVTLRAEPVPAQRRLDARLHLHLRRPERHPGRAPGAGSSSKARSRAWAATRRRPRATLIGAIIANAGLAAMDIADGGAAPSVAPLLHEVEAATARATTLYAHIRDFGRLQR